MAIVFAGLTVTFTLTVLQHRTTLQQEQILINNQVEQLFKQFERDLLELEAKARRSHQLIVRQLGASNMLQRSYEEPRRLSDGSRRQLDEYSGVFIAPSAQISAQDRELQRTALIWQQLIPLIQQDFFSVLFISKKNYVRATPADWVIDLNSDIALLDSPLYQLAMPQHNNQRLMQWSSIYYDSIWRQWLVAITMPVYQQDQFLGSLVFNLKLTDLLAALLPKVITQRPVNMLLLNQDNQLIHTHHEATSSTSLTMFSHYVGEEIKPVSLKNAIMQKGTVQADADAGAQYLIATSPVTRLGWRFVLFQTDAELLQLQADYRLPLLLLTLLLAVLITSLSYLLMNKIVLQRLKKLAIAVNKVGRGLQPAPHLDQHSDELGLLNRAFISMCEEINQLVTGLDSRIAEKEQAELLARKLSKAVAYSSSGIVITNHQLEIEYLNPFLTELLGLELNQMQGKPLTQLFSADMQQLSAEMMHTLKERQHWQGDVLLQQDLAKSVVQLWVTLTIAPIRDDKGELSHYVGALQDISFIKQSQKQMEQLAYFDSLTGLANRSYFRNQLRKALAMSQRGYYSFALLYFDLDEFKLINDTLGHDAGDELLVEVASRLTSRLREDDTIARLGGDEFAVILSDIKDKMHAGQIAASLQEAFQEPVQLGTHTVGISASIGITIAPEDAVDEELLLKHADLAMYEAKARGKNTYRFFSQELNDAANERLLIENQLREAIREQQFILFYQPKIDLRTETLVGYEALIRWLRPDNTLIPPARFISVAESTGLIVQIGEWIILEACRFLARQLSRGFNVTVSINLSARQFHDNNLPGMIERIIQRTGVEPNALVFEITESMLMGDTDAAIKQLNQLKRLGVSLSIDDFGTGYSSLSYLKRFPVDELKIDRSFVKDIPEDQNDMDIVAAIIAMAQKMQLRVVAEGVESAAQASFLKKNACHLVQGYYFSMPLAEQELSHLTFTIKT
ncbi:bifunctional diguanylate cyclase/phosphodiesterase [Alishewanella sp. d11]|uniref:bifunctional diguanylate cyclase/phosphodiesterase n=1 Tax=Alishewanella sp. d11 TaxID=3414030 RepID=UPI003BF899D3